MVNNFELIKPLLDFPHDQCFYFIQLLQRKKDHPGERVGGSNNNSRLIKAYHIISVAELEVRMDEIIKLCDVFNARACINLNPRSFEKAAFQLLVKVANQMHNRDFYNVRKAYDSVCGDYHAETDKRWLVDIDTQDTDTVMKIKLGIVALQAMSVPAIENGILAVLPTKSGYHLITKGFHAERFKDDFPGIDVHKNNPTNLYIP